MQLQSFKSLKKGYTLIELLVVITIISIVFFVGYANYREFSRRQALSGVTKTVKADLRLAQQLASSGQKPTVSCDTLNGYTFSITNATNYKILANCTSDSGAVSSPVFKNVDFETGVTLASTISSFQFKGLGQGTSLTSDIVLTLTHAPTNSTSTISIGKGGDIN